MAAGFYAVTDTRQVALQVLDIAPRRTGGKNRAGGERFRLAVNPGPRARQARPVEFFSRIRFAPRRDVAMAEPSCPACWSAP